MKPFYLKTIHKQYLMLGIASLILVGFLSLILWALNSKTTPAIGEEKAPKATPIETAHTRLNPQEIWVEKLEGDVSAAKEAVEHLEKKLNDKFVQLEKMIMESIGQVVQKDQELQNLRAENQMLLETPQKGEASSSTSTLSESEVPFKEDAFSQENTALGGTIKKIVLRRAQGHKKASLKKTVENTLPAGSFASGILLGGVDASTSIQAASDPRPILVRLTHRGTLPRQFKSDVQDCHVLASSYGDLSSERVYMRLEKLTCTERLTGEIIETQVAGYISGEDGKAGVRGTIVDRAGESVRNSLVGGFFSGISQFIGAQQQRSVYPISPFGQTNPLSPQQMLGAGAANGASSALEKYSDFFIKRAEQLQPVIQVAAGRRVDVVFTQGTFIGDSSVKKALGRMRDDTRRQKIKDMEQEGQDATAFPLQDLSPQTQESGL